MAICRGCGDAFQWGFCDGRWVPLEPVESHADLDKAYVDESGIPRADHRDRHEGSMSSVNVIRLDRKIPAEAPADPEDLETLEHDGFAGADQRDDEEGGWIPRAKAAFARARVAESEGCR